jgi:hypothetical protein
VTELKKQIYKAKSTYYPARQRLTLPAPPGAKSGEVLKDGATLDGLGLKDGSIVLFKDLGTQVIAAPWCAAAPAARLTGNGAAGGVEQPRAPEARPCVATGGAAASAPGGVEPAA